MTRWKLASATLAATVSMMALAVMTLAAGDDARLKTAVRFVDRSFSELRVIDQDTGRVHSRMRLDHVHSVLAPAHTHSGQPAFLSLVTLDSATGRTVIKRYAYHGDRH